MPQVFRTFQTILFSAGILCILVIAESCKTFKVAQIVTKNDSTLTQSNQEIKQRFDYKSSKTLLKLLDENEFSYRWLSTKINATVNIDEKVNEFNVFVRARKDSALWMSFQLFGIEGARLLATADSVKFIDRVNHKYFNGDYSFFMNNFNVEFDFNLIEALLIGNAIEFFRDDEKLRSFREEEKYILSTVRKRKLKKMLNRIESGDTLNNAIQRMYLSPDHFKITNNKIEDFQNNRSFKAEYSNFQQVDSLLFPFVQKFELLAGKKIDVTLTYQKVESGKVQAFPFSIPAKYEPVGK